MKGTRKAAIEVSGTGALNAAVNAAVNSVSCGSAGNCAASGTYLDSARHSQAFVTMPWPRTTLADRPARMHLRTGPGDARPASASREPTRPLAHAVSNTGTCLKVPEALSDLLARSFWCRCPTSHAMLAICDSWGAAGLSRATPVISHRTALDSWAEFVWSVCFRGRPGRG